LEEHIQWRKENHKDKVKALTEEQRKKRDRAGAGDVKKSIPQVGFSPETGIDLVTNANPRAMTPSEKEAFVANVAKELGVEASQVKFRTNV